MDGQMTGQTLDKVIPMCRYAFQATQKLHAPKFHSVGHKNMSLT